MMKALGRLRYRPSLLSRCHGSSSSNLIVAFFKTYNSAQIPVLRDLRSRPTGLLQKEWITAISIGHVKLPLARIVTLTCRECGGPYFSDFAMFQDHFLIIINSGTCASRLLIDN